MAELRIVLVEAAMTAIPSVLPRDSWKRKAGKLKVRIVSTANEPAKRFRLMWYSVTWICAIFFVVIGVGYAEGGHGVIQSRALNVIAIMEGNLHIHGILMMFIGIFLIYGLSDYRRVTRIGLLLYFFYSIWAAVQIFIGWGFYGVSWGAPWVYLLTASLSFTLIYLAPPLDSSGKRYAGDSEGSGGV